MTPLGCVAGVAVGCAALAARTPRDRPASRLAELAEPVRPDRSSWRLGRGAVVLLVVSGAAGALLVPGVFVVGMAAALLTPPAVLARRRRRARLAAAARSAAAVEVVYALAAELRVGQPPPAALAAVAAVGGPLGSPLEEAAAVARTGVPVADELRRLAELPGAEALLPVAAVWEVTERHGGPVADVLDRIGEALDADAAGRRALEAALAGPRATMGLLLLLPLLGIGLGEAAGARPLALLFHQPLGWGLLAGAVALDLAGVVWTRRLLRVVTRP